MMWEYFRYRWDRMQSADIADNKIAITRAQEDIRELERMLIYLLGKLAMGESVTLADPVIKEFLHLEKAGKEAEKELLETLGKIRHGADPRLTKCPKCGAGVRDLAGVHDEVCQWCGHQLQTIY